MFAYGKKRGLGLGYLFVGPFLFQSKYWYILFDQKRGNKSTWSKPRLKKTAS